MRLEKLAAIFSITVGLAVLAGCSATERLDSLPEDTVSNTNFSLNIDSGSIVSSFLTTPSYVSCDLLGAISVDATVKTPIVFGAVAEFTAQRIDWAPEQVVPLFFKNSFPEIRETTYANNPWFSCVSDEGTLNTGAGALAFTSSSFRPQIYDIALLSCQSPAVMQETFAGEQFSALDADEAIDDVLNLVEALGVTDYSEPSVYALSASKLNELAENNKVGTSFEDLFTLTKDDYNHAYTVDDEVCVVRLGISFDGVSVTKSSYSDGKSDRYYLGSSIDAWVTKAGIVRLFVSEGLNDFDVSPSLETIIPLDQALVLAATKYSDVISNSPLQIKEIRFEYVPRSQDDSFNTVGYTPAWYLSPGVAEEQYATSIRVDAITGEVF